MPISNPNPQPKDVVILQRDATNTYYGETHISASDVILHIDEFGNLNADKSASFYALYPPPSTAAAALSASWASSSFTSDSASWASQSLSTSFFITRDNPYPVDQRTVVTDITARNAIPLADRYLGLSVWVTDDSQEYTLIGGTNNSWWQATPISASHAVKADTAITATFALNAGGGGGANLVGSNNYVGYWWNNLPTTGSLIYVNDDNVGINTPTPIPTDTFTVTAVSSSNILWTPTLLGINSPRLWYKADAITDISASFLNLWPDSTPNQNHATASAPNSRPLLAYNLVNGYPAVRFDGTDDQMRCLVPTSVSCSALTAFVVAKVTAYAPTVANANVGTIFGNSHAGNDRDIVVGERFDGGSSRFTWTLYTEDETSNYATETPVNPYNAKTGEWYINTVIVNGGASSTTIYLSGSASGSGVSAQSTNLDLRDLCIGWESSSNQPFNGDIAEIVIITSSLSAGDQSRVEGYLAWKYGLQESLPVGHTYKSVMPTPTGGSNIQVWRDFNGNIVGFFSGSGILYATASHAISASWAPGGSGTSDSSSWASQSLSSSNSISASYAYTASSAEVAFQAISASWAPPTPSDAAISASWASESFWATSASIASRSFSATSASWASQSYFNVSSSWASQSFSSSYASQSFFATTASYATNVNPNALSASWASQSLSSSFATTASYAVNQNPNALSASWASASFVATSASFASRSFTATSASWASQSLSASWAPPIPSDYAVSASWASQSFWATTSSFASRSFVSTTASFASQSSVAVSASWASRSISSSFAESASWSPPQFNNYAESASWASQSLSASWAPTVGLVGTNYYIPKWLNNNLTTGSYIYDGGLGVGIGATGSQINASLTVGALPSTSSILWTPQYASVPMRVWLRGDDVTGSQSSSVSRWNDTGSYGNYFTQSVGASQPLLYTSSLNGHSVIRFDGTNDSLIAISGSTSISQSSLCVFAVVKPQTFPVSPADSSNATVISNGHSGNSRDFTFGPRIRSGVPQWNMYNESGTTSYNINASVNISQSWYIINGNVNANNSILTAYINGAATSSGVVNGSNDLDLRDLYVGYEVNFGQPFNGEIAEIIITTQVIDPDEQRRMEGYLAWKYNLAASNLPSDHPYIYSAPYALDSSTIQSWNNSTGDTVSYVSSSGLYAGTASWAQNANSASWAPPSGVTAFSISSSWASQSLSSSFATTASYALIAIGPGTPNYIAKWISSGSLSNTSSLYDDGAKVGLGTQSPSGSLTIYRSNTNAYTTATDHITLVNPSTTGQTHISSIISGSNSIAGRWRTDYVKNVVYVSYGNATGVGHWFNINGDTDVGDTKMKITSTGVRIGSNESGNNPSAILHIGAGDGTANRGQLKFTSTTLLSTPEVGVVEYVSDKWYGTISTGTARKEFALTDLSPMPSGSVVVTTTNGRLTVVTGSGVWNITSSFSVSASYANVTVLNWQIPGWNQFYLSESRLGSTGNTLPTASRSGQGSLVGDTVYLFGGNTTGNNVVGTIWTSSAGDGSRIGYAANKSLAIPVIQSNCVRIGESLYIFGGAIDAMGTPTSSIQTASLADPLTWTTTGSLLMDICNHATFVTNTGYVYLVGGMLTSSITNPNIYYATASNLASWSVVVPTWVGGGGYQTAIAGNGAILGDKLCLFGGFNGPGFTTVNTSVYTSSVSDPFTWGSGNAGATAAAGFINNSCAIIGNYYYAFGGWNGTTVSPAVKRAQISSPGAFNNAGSMSFNDMQQVAVISASTVFLYGGWNMPASASTTRIQSGSILNLGVTVLGDGLDITQNQSWSYYANYFIPSTTQSLSASWAVNSSQSLYGFVNTTTASQTYYIPFVTGSGYQQLFIDGHNSLSFNPGTDTLFVPFITASVFGTSSNAFNALSSSNTISSSWALTASYAANSNPTALSSSWASESFWATTSSFSSQSFSATSASWASQSISSSFAISSSWAPVGVSDFAISASFASSSIWANTASWASSSVTASYVPLGRSIVLCAAYTPSSIGADTAEVSIPFNPIDGYTTVSWNVKRLSIRTQTVETSTSSFDIEKSMVPGLFSASYIGTVTLYSSSYETASLVTNTVNSGDKIRFNVTNIGGAQNWTIITELSNA